MNNSDKFAVIEIRISGFNGKDPLSPQNYDISEIRALSENKEYGVRVKGMQNIETDEFDKSNLVLVGLAEIRGYC